MFSREYGILFHKMGIAFGYRTHQVTKMSPELYNSSQEMFCNFPFLLLHKDFSWNLARLKQSVLLFIKSRFINTYSTLKITGSFFSQLFVLCFFSSPKAQKDKLFGKRTRNHLFHVLQ